MLLFVIIHVKQFKFGTWYLASGSDTVRDLYRTEIEVFRSPLWVALYVIAMRCSSACTCATASRARSSRSASIIRATRGASSASALLLAAI